MYVIGFVLAHGGLVTRFVRALLIACTCICVRVCVALCLVCYQHAEAIKQDAGEIDITFRYFWQTVCALLMPVMTCCDALAVHGHKKRVPVLFWFVVLLNTLYIYAVTNLQQPWVQPVQLCLGDLCLRLFNVRTYLLGAHAVYVGYRILWLWRRPHMLLQLHAGLSFSVLTPQATSSLPSPSSSSSSSSLPPRAPPRPPSPPSLP
jgi:hypothetical protein